MRHVGLVSKPSSCFMRLGLIESDSGNYTVGDCGSAPAVGVDIAGVSVVRALTNVSRRPDRRPRPVLSGLAAAHHALGL